MGDSTIPSYCLLGFSQKTYFYPRLAPIILHLPITFDGAIELEPRPVPTLVKRTFANLCLQKPSQN